MKSRENGQNHFSDPPDISDFRPQFFDLRGEGRVIIPSILMVLRSDRSALNQRMKIGKNRRNVVEQPRLSLARRKLIQKAQKEQRRRRHAIRTWLTP